MAFVVFAGQSNALGFGMSAVTLASGHGEPDPLTFIWNDEARAFEVMQPGVNTGTAANPQAWGPEVGFAGEFRQDNPGEPLFIVKSAKGSTGLELDPERLDWSPRSQGEMFDLTAARVAAARGALGNPDVDAVFLVQGEQDGFVETWAQDYQANMTEWLSAIRNDWMQDPEGRIGFARIADSTPFCEAVQDAQSRADANDPLAASFDTYGYEMQADGLHYSAEGLLQIGANFESFLDAWPQDRLLMTAGGADAMAGFGPPPGGDGQSLFDGFGWA